MKLLLVEDDEPLRNLLARELSRDRFAVAQAASHAHAYLELFSSPFEILVIDRILPDGDGAELIATYRAHDGKAPVLMITARSSVDDRVQALESGADDVLIKPFTIRELRARIRTLLKRPAAP